MRVVIGLAFLFTLADATQVQAQTSNRVVVNIPFDFNIGQKRFPAGRYTIGSITRNSAQTLLVRSADGRASELITTNAVVSEREQATAHLDFRRYGDRYFLHQVWTPGVKAGRELPKSRLERSVASEMAKSSVTGDGTKQAATPQTVTVNASLQ